MIDRFTIIVGAARCGTTSLFHYLAEHPQISPARVKEPNFFASDEHYARGREWYESLWDWNPASHHVALEGTTAYSVYPVYPSAAKKMAQFGAEFKILYLVRNPMEQIPSNITLAHSMGSEWTDPDSGWWSGERVNPFFLACASYASQLEEYRRHFGPEEVLVLRFDDLKTEPRKLLARVCRFIGIDDTYDFKSAGEVVNATRGRVLPSAPWNRMKRISSLRRAFRMLPRSLREPIRARVGARAERAQTLSEEEMELVRERLASEVVRLREDWGVDVSGWDPGA